MNVSDPYYIGALPALAQFVIGVGILAVVGWALSPRKKK